MPNFFNTVEKFLGFGGKAVEAAEMTFVKETMGATSQMSMKVGGQTHGYVAWETSGKRASVYSTMMSEEYKGKGHGKMLYKKAAEALRMEGFTEFTSDITGHTEEEARHVWRSLGRNGYKVTEGIEGPKFRMDLSYHNIAESTAIKAKKAITLQHAEDLTKQVMKTGEGQGSTSMLRRGLSSVSGSRRTSSAL